MPDRLALRRVDDLDRAEFDHGPSVDPEEAPAAHLLPLGALLMIEPGYEDAVATAHGVLADAGWEGFSRVVLGGMLVQADHVAGLTQDGNDAWYSGKHRVFGANVQFLAGPDGDLLWISDSEPGSTHDIIAARIHALPVLYLAAANELPTLVDSGYQGAGIGIHTPIKHRPGPPPEADNETFNTLHRATRALGERAAAIVKQRFQALQHVTISPSRIGDIARAALALHHT